LQDGSSEASRVSAEYPILRTSDLDEARQSVGRKFCDHKLSMPRRSKRLNVRHNQVAGPNISLNYLHYGAEVEVDPGMLESFYLFQVPLNGKAAVRHCGKKFVSSSTKATLLNPDRESHIRWQEGCQNLLLQIDKTYLEQVATELLGVPAPGVVRFDPEVELSTTSGRKLRELIIKTTTLTESGILFSGKSTAQDIWAESDIVTAILRHQNSNISHILDRTERPVLSKGIRRAHEYIHTNLSEPICLQDIAKNADMNVRTLQKGFKSSFGLSPMQVLKNARLDAAAYQLTTSRHILSITDVAFSNGFSHMGRFSYDFKTRFGNLPSQMS
jgi:AraC-like DNA-binding protein